MNRAEQIKNILDSYRIEINGLIAELEDLRNEVTCGSDGIPYEVANIIKIICKYYNIDYSFVTAKTRDQDIRRLRQIIQYFIRDIFRLKYSLQKIALFTGLTNHSSILHSISVIDNEIKYNKTLAIEVIELRKLIDLQTKQQK